MGIPKNGIVLLNTDNDILHKIKNEEGKLFLPMESGWKIIDLFDITKI